jgi:hypothetical protein
MPGAREPLAFSPPVHTFPRFRPRTGEKVSVPLAQGEVPKNIKRTPWYALRPGENSSVLSVFSVPCVTVRNASIIGHSDGSRPLGPDGAWAAKIQRREFPGASYADIATMKMIPAFRAITERTENTEITETHAKRIGPTVRAYADKSLAPLRHCVRHLLLGAVTAPRSGMPASGRRGSRKDAKTQRGEERPNPIFGGHPPPKRIAWGEVSGGAGERTTAFILCFGGTPAWQRASPGTSRRRTTASPAIRAAAWAWRSAGRGRRRAGR